ncbi:polyphosphate--glucose phosphotransferase [Calditrichota bacterium]
MIILGVDIGGSGIKAAPVDIKTGKLLAERYRIPTPNPSTPTAVADSINKIRKQFNWTGKIGCGFPAVINNGIVCTASNIDKKWLGVDVIQILKKTTGCKLVVLNDADVAGIAEMKFGAGKKVSGLTIIITVGTGIGTAMFTGKKLVPNTEFGHLMLNGMIAEHYASDAVRKNENLSWKNWTFRFNEFLSEIDRLLWPDLIIIGGGASKKFEKYSHYLETKTKIIPAKLLNNAGIIGAALTARNL